MRRFCVGLAVFLLAVPAFAAHRDRDCGGDAYSSAEVVTTGRSARRRPIVSVPETLCADVTSGQDWRIESLSIYLDGRSNDAGAETPQARSRSWRRPPY
jgi:hypothetical protein